MAQSRRGKWSKLGDGTAFVGLVIIMAAEKPIFRLEGEVSAESARFS